MIRRLVLRWRIFWLWFGEAEAGSRRDYRLAHAYLRRRIEVENELR